MHGELTVDPARVAAYIRWSTDEQSEGTTLEVQREACRHYMLAQGWKFNEGLVFVDDGYSGGTLERPGLRSLRRAIAKGQVACVVVFKLDRLSRSVLDTVRLVLDEWDGLCYLKSTREPVDTTTAAGKMFFYMLASYAEWERSVIKERTMSGKAKRAQHGKNPGFTPPYGYQQGEKPGDLVVDQAEAVIVRRIFQEYLAGHGIHRIASGLTRDGIAPRRADQWSPTTVAQMLANPLYAGTLSYGRTAMAPVRQRGGRGSTRVRLAEPRYAVVEGAVPAIISAEQFQRAQQQRENRTYPRGRRPVRAPFLLAGIARCRCGAHLRGDTRSSTGHRYYRCTSRGPETACPGAMVPADLLEEAVVQEVQSAFPAPDQVRTARWLQQEQLDERGALQATLAQAARALAELDRRRRRLDADYDAGLLPAPLYAERVDQIRAEAESLRLAEERASSRLQEVQVPAGRAHAGIHPWKALTDEERNQVLRLAVQSCEVGRVDEGESSHIQVDLTLVTAEPGRFTPRKKRAVSCGK